MRRATGSRCWQRSRGSDFGGFARQACLRFPKHGHEPGDRRHLRRVFAKANVPDHDFEHHLDLHNVQHKGLLPNLGPRRPFWRRVVHVRRGGPATIVQRYRMFKDVTLGPHPAAELVRRGHRRRQRLSVHQKRQVGVRVRRLARLHHVHTVARQPVSLQLRLRHREKILQGCRGVLRRERGPPRKRQLQRRKRVHCRHG